MATLTAEESLDNACNEHGHEGVKSLTQVYDVNQRTVWFHSKTLFLFTKSDFKTVVVPQSLFAIAVTLSRLYDTDSAPEGFHTHRYVMSRLLPMLAWIWLHLLVENISNQRLRESVLEDSVNKPWRPLPSGRVSASEAQRWLQALIPSALATSLFMGSFTPSVTLMTFIWLYNDLDGSSTGPWQRNAINAAGLACFGWGASEVLIGERARDGESTLFHYWFVLMAVVVTTTVHAQDMPDMDGDRARGRKTMPLLYSEKWARGSLATFILLWSIVCPYFWGSVTALAWIVPLGIGCAMAFFTLFSWKQPTDEMVWKLWCLWIAVIYTLPLLRRN